MHSKAEDGDAKKKAELLVRGSLYRWKTVSVAMYSSNQMKKDLGVWFDTN